MHLRRIFYLFALVLCLLFCLPAMAHWYKVTWVIDGDTIILEDGRHIRYLGINAPEIPHDDKPGEPFGKEALKFNIDLVKNKYVRLEMDREKTDRYGRILAYVFLKDGTFVNAALIKKGYAYVLSIGPNIKYRDILLKYQREAMKDNKGIWTVILNETAPYYIGNKKTKVFHRPDCPFGLRTSPFNRIKFHSKWDAFYEGYHPCKRCQP